MNNDLRPINTIPNFKRFCMTIGELPTSYLETMTYYEMLVWFTEYMKNTIIPTINNNGLAVQELQDKYIELKSYVDNYFTNLDVQQEINNKLDQMTQSGELTNLIKNYIDPLFNEYKTEINNNISNQNNIIQNMNNKIDSVTNGTPLPAESMADMTDTSKIYVLLTDGYWYYYNGTSWVQGGQYQKIVANYDTTLTIEDGVADSKSIGERINNNFYKTNYLDNTDYIDNKKYNSDGTIIDDNSYIIFNSIIPLKQGDTLYLNSYKDNTITSQSLGQIIQVNAYGEFISLLTTNSVLYKATQDCFIKINWLKNSATNYGDLFTYINTIDNDYINTKFKNKNSELINTVNKTINDNTVQYNYLDKNKCILNQNLDNTGKVVYSNNGFFITNLIPVKNGDIVRFYNFNSTGTYNMIQLCKYDNNKQFIERISVSNNTYVSTYDGYLQANCTKPTSIDTIENLDISINNELSKHYEYGKLFLQNENKKVKIKKINNTNFEIIFGDYNITLFKFINSNANANAWNIKTIKKNTNILVPEGTDIIGPVRINNNTDFIGGVHGDETTLHIILSLNGTSYKDDELENINELETDRLTITLISNIYDQQNGELAFTRNVIINFTNNKIHISNTYKAKKDLILKVACIGGLIACQNSIIKDITMNNSYFNTPPTESTNNNSKFNTFGVINTIYGSIQINNIKGHENPNYIGYLVTYSNESPIRNKIYFNPYHYGNYQILSNDELTGEFEYIFS